MNFNDRHVFIFEHFFIILDFPSKRCFIYPVMLHDSDLLSHERLS